MALILSVLQTKKAQTLPSYALGLTTSQIHNEIKSALRQPQRVFFAHFFRGGDSRAIEQVCSLVCASVDKYSYKYYTVYQ